MSMALYKVTRDYLTNLTSAEAQFVEQWGVREDGGELAYFEGTGDYSVSSAVNDAKANDFDMTEVHKEFLTLLRKAVKANGGCIVLQVL